MKMQGKNYIFDIINVSVVAIELWLSWLGEKFTDNGINNLYLDGFTITMDDSQQWSI